MGTEYLTEAAVFQCTQGRKFQADKKIGGKASYKGKKLLTSPIRLIPKQPPILCPLLPPLPNGAPSPCSCTFVTLEGGVEHKDGGKLLTMKASVLCGVTPALQPIIPTRSGSDNHIIYGAAHNAKVPAIVWPVRENTKATEQTMQKEAGTGKTTTASAAAVPLTQENPALAKKNTPQKEEDAAEKTAAAPTEEDVPSFRAGMLCSCSPRKAECVNCTYRLDNEPPAVDNDSMILRKNYNSAKPHTDRYDRYFDEVVVPLGDSKENKWRYAAHHLISGNQVFKQNPELVRLAHFCGYDINAYANCIMLVGYPEDYPDVEHMKSVSAYDVMSESRVQWHVGGHSYRFDVEEKAEICRQIGIRNKRKLAPSDIKTYAELVQTEIEKLKQRLMAKKDRQMICYAAEQEKRKLCGKLDHIAAEIKSKLAAFTDVGKPHHSFPYFVSKEAYRYTYALPRTAKVVTVHKEGTQLSLECYRLEHFTEAIAQQKNSLVLNPKGTIILNLSDEKWRWDCIDFCKNIVYFIYLDDTPRTILPFMVENTNQFPPDVRETGRDGMKFLQQNDTEILVWLRDHPASAYTSPVLMIRRRRKEAGLDSEVM
ncbi:hypothetical protein [uncultured Selenomonas sp.]|uniref:hypothetical protein n=1 Tax=uncultured Selenomonas sp. TaxID=159275 RepID=UPI0028DB677D|nr:hypothetical protein [uncultured Selenomonas sp.]